MVEEPPTALLPPQRRCWEWWLLGLKLPQHAFEGTRCLQSTWCALASPEAAPEKNFILEWYPPLRVNALGEGGVVLMTNQSCRRTTLGQLIQQARESLVKALVPGRFPQQFIDLRVITTLLTEQTSQSHVRFCRREQHTTAGSDLIEKVDGMAIHDLALMAAGGGLIQGPDQRCVATIDGFPRAAKRQGS